MIDAFARPGVCADLAVSLYGVIGESCLSQADAILTSAFDLSDISDWPGWTPFCSTSRNMTIVNSYCSDGVTGVDILCELYDKTRPTSSTSGPVLIAALVVALVMNMLM